MTLQTERLLLRPWREADAPALFQYAKHPDVGPIAGWPVHTSVENSREIIRDVLSAEQTYAVVLRQSNEPIGSAGFLFGENSNLPDILPDEAEIGYWLGVPHWGRGLIPEAVRELLRYGFEVLGLSRIWCASFEGNVKSERVQQKCGFRYHHTLENQDCPLIHAVRTERVSCITKSEWLAEHAQSI